MNLAMHASAGGVPQLMDRESTHSRRSRTIAMWISLAFLSVTLVAMQLGFVHCAEIKSLVAVVATMWSLADLLTAILLFARFSINGTPLHLVLGAAYATNAIFTWPYLLGVPGLFFPDGHSVGEQQISATFWMIWHTIFASIVMIAALADRPLRHNIVAPDARRKLAAAAIATIVGFTGAIVALVESHRATLPHLIINGRFQPVFTHVLLPAVTALTVAALAVLGRRGKSLTTLQLWLLVALFTGFLECVLNEISPRLYSLGWYTSKIEALATATVVLTVLVIEVVNVYHRALDVARRSSDLERYRLLAERTRDLMMFARQRDGRILHANAAALGAYGYTLEQMLDLTIDELQSDVPAYLAKDALAATGHVSVAYEAYQRRADGTLFPGEVTIESRLIDGELIQLSIVRDISERRETNRRLEELNGLMLMAEEMANIGYWQLDLRTQEVHWSDEVYRIHGLTKAQPPTLAGALDFYAPDDRRRVSETLERALADASSFRFEAQIVRPDGTVRDVISMGQLERALDGTPLNIHGAFQDITERKRVERERNELIARVTLANEAAKIGVWDWDVAGKAFVWDHNMYALRGLDALACAGASEQLLFETIHPADLDRVRVELTASLDDGAAYDTEYRVVWPTGAVHYIRSKGTVVREADGTAVRMVGTNWDNTEVRQLAEELHVEKEQLLAAKHAAEEANAVKSDFLASMSHEIRTPMNGIIGLTSMLLDTDPTPEQQNHLRLLADAGRALLAIINDILDLSKVEAGKIELEAIALTPAGLVEGAVAIVRSEALAKGIALDVKIAPDVPAWVNGDPTRLRQILLNLLTNALKFTERGRVDVSVWRDPAAGEDFLRFEVADTGIGIAPERQHLLFQNFSQLDRSNARKYGGTGLGLAISRRLTQAMEGTMGVTSTPGVGSTFWFTARLPKTANASAQSLPTPGRSIFDVARRILVVDDNPINQIVARGLLVQDGHDVVLVADGAQALAAVQGSAFDLVLMDMQMPVMDGLEAARRIRVLSGPVRNIPIVALTANAMPDQIAACRAAGMDDHLSKPIDRELLRQVIAIWTMSGDWKRAGSLGATSDPLQQPDGSAAALETDLLLELFDGDTAAVGALLEAALRSIQTDLATIECAVSAHDGHAVIEAAHRVKGTAGSLRANEVLEAAAAIEAIPKTEPWTVTPDSFATLTAAVARLGSAIAAHSHYAIPEGAHQ